MAPQYKLTYFNARGVVEPIRYMFAYKEVEYEDIRVTMDDWPAMKPSTPFGKLPIIEFGDHKLAESQAIARYVAKELGLYGKTNYESARIDMYLDALKDNLTPIRTFIREEDKTKKAEMAKAFFTETLPPYMNTMEKFLKENGGKYYVGDELTWVDLSIGYAMKQLYKHCAELTEKYPVMAKHADFIHALPQIDAWVAKRPETEF